MFIALIYKKQYKITNILIFILEFYKVNNKKILKNLSLSLYKIWIKKLILLLIKSLLFVCIFKIILFNDIL